MKREVQHRTLGKCLTVLKGLSHENTKKRRKEAHGGFSALVYVITACNKNRECLPKMHEEKRGNEVSMGKDSSIYGHRTHSNI
jgi:hypothetical protein